MTLIKKLKNLLAAEETPKAPVRPPVSRPVMEAVPGTDEAARQVRNALRTLSTTQGEVLAGNIHFIDLDPLKEQIGATRWAGMEIKIHELSRLIIARHVGPRDAFIQYTGLEYLIVFADRPKEAAQLACLKIAEEIWARLVGIEGMAGLRIKSAVTVVDGDIVTEDVDPRSCLNRLAAQIQAVDASEVPLPAGAASASASAPLPATAPEEEKPRHDRHWRVTTPSFDFSQIRFAYRPMWDTRGSAISRFVCYPMFADGQKVPAEYGMLPTEWLGALTVELDLRMLLDCTATLAELHANSFRFVIAALVHFETLASSKHRFRYIEALRRLDPELRRLFHLELVGSPAGVPASRLTELAAVRSHCQALALRTDLSFAAFDMLRDSGIRAVGIDLAEDRRSEALIMNDMRIFAERADRNGLVAYAHGVRSRSLGLAAATAGFTFIDGAPVMEIQEWPGHLKRYGWMDFYDAHGRR